MSLPGEYILKMGYYPDAFWNRGAPPDVFFIHVSMTEEYMRVNMHTTQIPLFLHTPSGQEHYWDVLADAIEACTISAREKYGDAFDIADCFWSCSPKPEGV